MRAALGFVMLAVCACGTSSGQPPGPAADHAVESPADATAAGQDLAAPDLTSTDAAPTDSAAPPPADAAGAAADGPAAAGRNILFVVGTNNGLVQAGEGLGDKIIRARLEGHGHKVTPAADSMAAGPLVQAANASELVLVSESVSSAYLQGKLKPVTAPILSYEAFIQDEMGLTPPGPPGDPGLPADFALGVKFMDTKIDIVDPTHPLAAGLMGTVAVYKEPREVTWGKVAPTAEVVATLAGDKAGVCIYVYRQGAKLYDGTTAAGLRVGFFLEDDDKVGTPNVLTDEGLKLFDTAVDFTAAGGK